MATSIWPTKDYLHVEPKPKRKGLLSLRTPVDLRGSFSHIELSLEKEPLIARAGAAPALTAVNPLAALLPLIETGPGEDTPCRSVLQAAEADPTRHPSGSGEAR